MGSHKEVFFFLKMAEKYRSVPKHFEKLLQNVICRKLISLDHMKKFHSCRSSFIAP